MSDPSGIAARLRRIQEARSSLPSSSKKELSGDLPPPGPDWEPLARLLWVKRTEIDNPLSGSRPLPLLTAGVARDRDLVFLDIETTGLSGGAGTIAFLVGTGRVVGGRFRVEQYFITDYPGEPDLIERLARELNDRSIVVSYNGKSFDLPILRSRFALNGKELTLGGQIDLLHVARRLWRASIGSCTLQAIEEQVLGIERSDDVPGYLVPEIYFAYLRGGDSTALQPVFSHHLHDIVSLAVLLDYVETLPSRPATGVDTTALGKLMLDRGMPSAVELLRERALAGSYPAARVVSLHLKRLGRWEEAVEIWLRLWERSSSYFAGVELAKFYEHRARNHPKALEVVERISALPLRGSPWAAAAREDTRRRRERLLRKIASKAGGGGRPSGG